MDSNRKHDLHVVSNDNGHSQEQSRRIHFRLPKMKLPADPLTRSLIGMIALVLVFALIGYWSFNRIHLFEGFHIEHSAPREDAEGTRCEILGKTLIKYSHDGVFAQDFSGTLKWSSAYSMQTPQAGLCGGKMIIYEQLGTNVCILNEKGLEGTYQVPMPIRKAVVGKNGVAAMVIEDRSKTLIELYSPAGSEIASIQATIDETGYPLDIAISDKGERVIVSYLALENGKLAGKIVIYDFSGYRGKDFDHVLGSFSYSETVFPEVFFMGDGQGVAVGDDRFIIYSSASRPAETVSVTLEKEIVSCFYDDSALGFIFPSDETENRYEIDVYSYSGKHLMKSDFNFEYEDVRMEGREVLLHDSGSIYVYRTSGKPKLAASYPKEVFYFRQIPGLRRYLVITPDSVDQIRIR